VRLRPGIDRLDSVSCTKASARNAARLPFHGLFNSAGLILRRVIQRTAPYPTLGTGAGSADADNDRPRGERAGVRLAALLPVAQAVARGRKPRTEARRYKAVALLVSSRRRPRAVLSPCMLLIGNAM
jgi:hypothetical protein